MRSLDVSWLLATGPDFSSSFFVVRPSLWHVNVMTMRLCACYMRAASCCVVMPARLTSQPRQRHPLLVMYSFGLDTAEVLVASTPTSGLGKKVLLTYYKEQVSVCLYAFQPIHGSMGVCVPRVCLVTNPGGTLTWLCKCVCVCVCVCMRVSVRLTQEVDSSDATDTNIIRCEKTVCLPVNSCAMR